MNARMVRLGLAARLVPVLFSAAVWICVWGLLGTWFYLVLVVLVVVARRWRSPRLLRWRYGARPAQRHEADAVLAALVPAPSLRGRRQPRVWVGSASRLDGVLALTTGDVALPAPMLVTLLRRGLDPDEFGAATVWTIGTRHAQGDSRFHDALEVCCLPAGVLGMVTGPLRGAVGSPLVRLCWQARGLYGVIGLAQTLPTERAWAGIGAVIVITLSYLHPWWQRRWYTAIVEAGDDAVAAQGLGAVWARSLRRHSRSLATETRATRLDALSPRS